MKREDRALGMHGMNPAQRQALLAAQMGAIAPIPYQNLETATEAAMLGTVGDHWYYKCPKCSRLFINNISCPRCGWRLKK